MKNRGAVSGVALSLVLGVMGLLFVISVFSARSVWANQDDYSQQEKRLSQVPKYPFFDKRLKRIFAKMAKQYKRIYAHAAADSYILPDELRDLQFQRQFMHRLYVIDQRHTKVKQKLEKFEKLCHRKYYRERRLARRRGKMHKMKPEDEKQMSSMKKEFQRYEDMIRRFSCMHLADYKRKHLNNHCRRRS